MRGFTLLEVLVSLLLLSIAFLGVDAVFTTALHQERAHHYALRAYLLANNMSQYLYAHHGQHFDYDQLWRQHIQASLPDGRGVVDRQEIRISWGGVDVLCSHPQIGITGCIKLAILPK